MLKKFLIRSILLYIFLVALCSLPSFIINGSFGIIFVSQFCSLSEIKTEDILGVITLAAFTVFVSGILHLFIYRKEKKLGKFLVGTLVASFLTFLSLLTVFYYMTSTSRPDPVLYLTCMYSNDSPGCDSCLSCDKTLCNSCESYYNKLTRGEITKAEIPSQCR